MVAVSLINLTGFGVKLSDAIVPIGQGSLFLCLICPIVMCIILVMEPEAVRALRDCNAIEVFNTGTERLCHAAHAEGYRDMQLRDGKRVACTDERGRIAWSNPIFFD